MFPCVEGLIIDKSVAIEKSMCVRGGGLVSHPWYHRVIQCGWKVGCPISFGRFPVPLVRMGLVSHFFPLSMVRVSVRGMVVFRMARLTNVAVIGRPYLLGD